MNKVRRKNLQSIVDKLEELMADVEAIQEEEEEYRDNIPENMQSGERYEQAEAAGDALSEATDSISSAIDSINEAMGE